jgi:8-oxo-dGTP pyrophosphatase MutT (NUDIX family)
MTGVQDQGEGSEQPKRRRRRRRRRKPSGATGTAASRATATPAAEGAKPRKKPQGAKSKAGHRKPPPGKGPVQKEVSAGGVVYRPGEHGLEVILASRRTRRGELAWGLAKGGIEEGEDPEAAAVREVREETGLTAQIEADLGDTKYFYVWDDVRIRKTVHFFLMRHTGGDTEDRDDEMEEVRWFPLERAIKRAAYRGERDMLQRAAEHLR